MRTSRASNEGRGLKRLAAAALLASAAIPAQAGDAVSAANAQSSQTQQPDIIVIGERLFRDVFPERSLDEAEIEGYGVSTIDELLATIQAELGEDGEMPLIIVDGQRIDDISEIATLPIEALRNVQVLPRGSAVRAGGRSGQRVVNLKLRSSVRSVTITAAPRIATDGDGESVRGEAIYTHIRGKTRGNISLRGRGEDPLFESDRDIIQREAAFPYALGGNVIPYPDLSGEIDPVLSDEAGQVISVAPIPDAANPTLADFASGAANATDLGRFRTLRPKTKTYELNGTFRTPLAPWLTGSASLRLSRSTSESLRGLPAGLFLLPDENPASPFSRDIRLAYYGPSPLEHRSRRNNGDGSVTLDAIFGAWTGDLSAKHSRSSNLSRNQRQSTFGLTTLEDSENPFATPVDSLIGITANRAESRTNITRIQSRMNGPAADFRRGRCRRPWKRSWSGTASAPKALSRSRKSAMSAVGARDRGALDIPLTSRANNFMPQVGDLSATLELGRFRFSDAGSIGDYAAGLTWEPVETLRLRAAIERTGRPAPIELLGGPVIITPETRVFDPLTGETVDVVQITGGDSRLEGGESDDQALDRAVASDPAPQAQPQRRIYRYQQAQLRLLAARSERGGDARIPRALRPRRRRAGDHRRPAPRELRRGAGEAAAVGDQHEHRPRRRTAARREGPLARAGAHRNGRCSSSRPTTQSSFPKRWSFVRTSIPSTCSAAAPSASAAAGYGTSSTALPASRPEAPASGSASTGAAGASCKPSLKAKPTRCASRRYSRSTCAHSPMRSGSCPAPPGQRA